MVKIFKKCKKNTKNAKILIMMVLSLIMTGFSQPFIIHFPHSVGGYICSHSCPEADRWRCSCKSARASHTHHQVWKKVPSMIHTPQLTRRARATVIPVLLLYTFVKTYLKSQFSKSLITNVFYRFVLITVGQ